MKNEFLIKDISSQKETVFINPRLLDFDLINGLMELVVSDKDIKDASDRLNRFAPFIKKCFPETAINDGIIESELKEIKNMKNLLSEKYDVEILGDLYLKMDSDLPIAGSVKARGGIYEVLKHAETLAIENGKLNLDDDYSKFSSDEMKEFFSAYTVQVGSTGNLGLSIGIMSNAIGFNVIVHMSSDAKEWKKELLRSKGVKVLEYDEDYGKAVFEGRKLSDKDPRSYFVDDENSIDLFLGYAVAAERLKTQLDELNIEVSDDKPLVVYIPAGVGGAPGGVGYGLKRVFKDNVHLFFVEPTLYPSILLGIATQKFEKINVNDFGVGGITAADGLACASPSGLVSRIMTNLLSGGFTVEDSKLFDYLRLLNDSENIRIEPSSCAVFMGLINFYKSSELKEYCKIKKLDTDKLRKSIHIAWATGGSLVPEEIMNEYLNKNKSFK